MAKLDEWAMWFAISNHDFSFSPLSIVMLVLEIMISVKEGVRTNPTPPVRLMIKF